MKVAAVIVAGGSGTRMGAGQPKQFLMVGGVPIFIRTLQTFHTALPDAQLVLVMPAAHFDTARSLITSYQLPVTLIAGGETRFHSVCAGLGTIEEADYVMVHDAVRCLLTPALIERCLATAVEKGNSLPVIDCVDTPRLLLEDGTNESLDRSRLKLVQTPQTFRLEDIRKVICQVTYTEQFTDEATVMQQHGHAIHLVAGEEWNIKITRRQDLVLAEWVLRN